MTTTPLHERIESLLESCRHVSYPDQLLAAVRSYLEGGLSLADLKRQVTAVRGRAAPTIGYGQQRLVEPFDDLAVRVLTFIYHVSDYYRPIASYVAYSFDLDALAGRLQQEGWTAEQVDNFLLSAVQDAVTYSDEVLPLGHWLLRRLPAELPQILKALARTRAGGQPSYDDRDLLYLIKLLVMAQPPLNEEAGQVLTLISPARYSYGEALAELVEADPGRYVALARQVAGDPNTTYSTRQQALEALVAQDARAHLDMVRLVIETPKPAQSDWHYGQMVQSALALGMQADPDGFEAHAARLAFEPEERFAVAAARLLVERPFANVADTLRRAVAEALVEVALVALEAFAPAETPDRTPFLLGVLAHRSQQVRQAAVRLLGQTHTPAELALVARPLLTHRSADARLEAVALVAAGSEEDRALVAARLDAEKSEKVRRRIIDLVGAGAAPAAAAPADSTLHPAAAAFEAEAAATMRRIKKPALEWLDPAAQGAPGLRWADGTPLSPDAFGLLLYRQSRFKGAQLDPQLAPVVAQLDRRQAADLGLALWEGWRAAGEESRESWAIVLAGALGDDRLVAPMREAVEAWAKTSRGALAARTVAALALVGSERALADVEELAGKVRHAQVREAATGAFAAVAAARGLSPEELSDQIVSRLGFDARGEQRLDYGPRSFSLRLRPDLSPELRDPQGKLIASLPRAGKADDPDLAAAAQAAWKEIKTRLKPIARRQVARLQQLLINQNEWAAPAWRAIFLDHPILRALAVGLVWRAGDLLFRPLPDGSLTDADDETVALDEGARVRLAHPIELEQAAIEAWARHLADYEVEPPFAQLSRPVLRPEPGELDGIWWTKYVGYVLNGGALKSRYLKAGWERGSVQDGGAYHTLIKRFPRYGIDAVLETAGLAINIEQEFNTATERLVFIKGGSMEVGSYVYDDVKDNDPRALRLGDVPPVVFSEAAADVQGFAAAGSYSEDWKRKVW